MSRNLVFWQKYSNTFNDLGRRKGQDLCCTQQKKAKAIEGLPRGLSGPHAKALLAPLGRIPAKQYHITAIS
jgi:hypothetical protein